MLFNHIHGYMPLVMGVALFCFAQVSQPPQSPQNVDSRPFNRVKKREGWLTPEITKLQKTISTKGMLIDDIAVKVTRLEPPEETSGHFDVYWLDRGGLLVHSVTASIQAIFSYEHEKKVFAYSASYVPYVVEEHGTRSYAGGIFTFYYYDEDGDGVFETRYSNTPSALFVPKWVRPSR